MLVRDFVICKYAIPKNPHLHTESVRVTSGFGQLGSRVISSFASTVTPLLWVSAGLWLPFIVFALAHGVAALSVVVLGIETKGKVLEEIAD